MRQKLTPVSKIRTAHQLCLRGMHFAGEHPKTLITFGADGLACSLTPETPFKMRKTHSFHYQRGGHAKMTSSVVEDGLFLASVDDFGTLLTAEVKEEEEEDKEAAPILRRRKAPQGRDLAWTRPEVTEKSWSALQEDEVSRANRRAHAAQIEDIEDSLEHVKRQVSSLAAANKELPKTDRLDA